MQMIYLLIGFSILLALIFLLAFFWASKSGQHDDLYTPAVRILFEDQPAKEQQKKTTELKKEETGQTIQEKSDEDHSQV